MARALRGGHPALAPPKSIGYTGPYEKEKKTPYPASRP